MTLELYRQLTGTNVQHVPFKGAAPAMVSLAGGEIEFVIEALPACLGYIKSNKVRPLAVTTPQRHALLPATPTATEAGLPGLTLTSWTGLMVPSATPKDVVKRIYEEVAGALKQPDMVQKVREQGFEVVASAPDEAQAFITKEVERWGKVVREANVKPD